MNNYYGRDGEYYYDYRDNGFYDDMSHPVSNCSRFERRHDFSMFNMADYMSCENCRHLSADNKCIAHQDTYIGSMK